MEECQSGWLEQSWKLSYVCSVPWVRIPPPPILKPSQMRRFFSFKIINCYLCSLNIAVTKWPFWFVRIEVLFWVIALVEGVWGVGNNQTNRTRKRSNWQSDGRTDKLIIFGFLTFFRLLLGYKPHWGCTNRLIIFGSWCPFWPFWKI